MDKITYLAELAEGLARWVPERERQDILRYYAEYFDEAGIEREAEVVAELGDPWALASRLAVEGGYVTQERANSWTPPKKNRRSLEIAACVAIAMIVIVVAVASLASRVGRLFGNLVGGSGTAQVAVVEGEEYVGFVPVDPIPGVIFSEDEMSEAIGGFWSMEDGWLDPFYAIDADISLGNIAVTSGEDFTLFIQQGGDLGGYSLEWEIQGDTLKIRDSDKDTSYNIGLTEMGNVLGDKAMDVVITVPHDTVLHTVNVKTKKGNVFLSELDVEVKASAESEMGDIECYDVQTPNKLKLETEMGDITASISQVDYDSMDMEVETEWGDVEVNMSFPARLCSYKLETELGAVSVNGNSYGTKTERKEGGTICKLEAKSEWGDVNAYFDESKRG